MKSNQKNFFLLVLGLFFCNVLFAAEYKIGVRAHNGIEEAIVKWQATVDVLSEKIPQHNFKLVPIISLKEITIAAGRGDIDFLLTNPSSYVENEILHGAQALVTLNNKRSDTAQTRFGSVIFTHATNSNIRTLEDLKGKTLMAVSKQSFGGWRVAWMELLQNGIDPYSDFKQVLFDPESQHPNVVYAIRDGKADAGVVRTDKLERLAAAKKIDLRYFRILNIKNTEGFPFFHSTPLYPEWPFAAMKTVPSKLADQVREVLLNIKSDSIAAKNGKYIGWVPALNYGSVEALMKQLQAGPFADNQISDSQSKGLLNNFPKLFVIIFIGVVLLILTVYLRKKRHEP